MKFCNYTATPPHKASRTAADEIKEEEEEEDEEGINLAYLCTPRWSAFLRDQKSRLVGLSLLQIHRSCDEMSASYSS